MTQKAEDHENFGQVRIIGNVQCNGSFSYGLLVVRGVVYQGDGFNLYERTVCSNSEPISCWLQLPYYLGPALDQPWTSLSAQRMHLLLYRPVACLVLAKVDQPSRQPSF